MGTLADILTQQRPNVQTRKALLVLDLQNDFAPEGRLPVTYAAGLANLGPLCDAFRTEGDHVVWLRTEYSQLQQFNSADETAGDDPVIVLPSGEDEHDGDDSEEEFLRSAPPSRSTALLKRVAERNKLARASASPPRELFLSDPAQNSMQRCCQHGSHGADFVPSVAQLIDAKHDMVVFKNTYSAFSSTNLLFQLRARLVTELFISGSLTNVSVYATAASAVQHGMQVTILQDCLGYTSSQAHDEALRRMKESMGATISNSTTFVRPSRPGTLRSKKSAVLPRISAKDSRDDVAEPPATVASPTSASARARSKLPQRSPDGARTMRSDSKSAHDSPTSSRIPLVRGESYSSVSGDSPQLERRTSSLALRQKPTSIPETPAKWQDVVLKRSISQQFKSELQSPGSEEGSQISKQGSENGTGVETLKQKKEELESSRSVQRPKAKLRRPAAAVSIGDGDSMILHDSLDDLLDDGAFARLKKEVYWQRMFHVAGEVPRLVCAQGLIDPSDGSMPVYRHPADHTLPLLHFSPMLDRIRRRVEEEVGHPINHCLAQLYRSGQDFISEHSDKTLDIVHGSWIVNVSVGAQRTMRLRSKRAAQQDTSGEPKARQTQTIPLPHGSIFLLGPEDNAKFLHSIQANKRPAAEKLEAEQAYGGERISLTFRYIGTFLDAQSQRIWGQGASSKTRSSACHVVNGDAAETERMVRAFGTENQSGVDFDWDGVYGGGFDVLHLHTAKQANEDTSSSPSSSLDDNVPILFRTQSADVALPIEMFLRQKGMAYATLLPPPSVVFTDAGAIPDMMLRDADTGKTQVVGLEAILLYLDRFYGTGLESRVPDVESQRLVLSLARMTALPTPRFLDVVEALLRRQDTKGEAYLGGANLTIADYAYWALVEDAVDEQVEQCAQRWPLTYDYHRVVAKLLGGASGELEWHDAAENW